MVVTVMRVIMAVGDGDTDNPNTGDDGGDDHGDVDSYADEEKLDGVDYDSDDGDGGVMVVMMMTNDNNESLHFRRM